jgi:hypothetical protein
MAKWDRTKLVDLTTNWCERYRDFYVPSDLTNHAAIRDRVDSWWSFAVSQAGSPPEEGADPEKAVLLIHYMLNRMWYLKKNDDGHEAPRDNNGDFLEPPGVNRNDIAQSDGTDIDPNNTSIWGRVPSPEFAKKSKAEQDAIAKALQDAGFLDIINNFPEIELLMKQHVLFTDWPTKYQQAFNLIMGDPRLLGYGLDYFAGFRILVTHYNSYLKEQIGVEKAAAAQEASYSKEQLFDSYLEAFFGPKAKEEGYQFAFYADTTRDKLGVWLQGHSRPDTTPASVLPWELRLGAARFSVPPINIDVSQGYHTGSLTGGVLRAKTSPKFNTGHMETMISMTLYFPTHETIWGFEGMESQFNWEEDTDDVIDEYLSSLRGLITQFRYAPILPIRNQYINSTLGVTAVALQSMSIQTVPDFPFCMQVQLNLLSFNHKVFLPMINDFHNAIHWGRYRQYMGRAAAAMAKSIGEGFLVETTVTNSAPDVPQTDPTIPAPTNYPDSGKDGLGKSRPITVQDIHKEIKDIKDNSFSKTRDLNNKAFDLYYPVSTPLRVFAPDTQSWRQPYENDTFGIQKDAWAAWLGTLGVDVNTYPEAIYEVLKNSDQNYSGQIPSGINTQLLLLEYLRTLNINSDLMTRDALNAYLSKRRGELEKEFRAKGKDFGDSQWAVFEQDIKVWWFRTMFSRYTESPLVRQYLAAREQQKNKFTIHEWEVPMEKLGLDPKNVIVNGVSVGMSNNFTRMHLQMQAEPVYQHISGGDSTIDVSLTIFGEDDIIRLRRALEHVNGLARLEYAHGILGFVGVKNVITALAGIKYALPTSFEIETVPGFPRVYNVRLSFVDFDIFQQKREELSSEQQEEIVVAFGKRNPFLRIKQLWGAFNAYPDFPLGVYEKDPNDGNNQKLVGYLDPDFYFRSFQTIDDDLVEWNLNQRASQAEGPVTVFGVDIENISKKIDDLAGSGQPGATPPPSAAETGASILNAELGGPTSTVGDIPYTQTLYGKAVYEQEVSWALMPADERQEKIAGLKVSRGDIVPGHWDKDGSWSHALNAQGQQLGAMSISEDTANQTLSVPSSSLEGLSPHGENSPAMIASGFKDGDLRAQSNDPAAQYEAMMIDAQYRNISGRMVRAFPTYMLWLIDETGKFAGVKLFDNFYGLQSVLDFSVSQSEDNLGDTLVLRLSNLYGKLNTQLSGYLGTQNDDGSPTDPKLAFIDRSLQYRDFLANNTDQSHAVKINGIRIRPGVRVHLRAGYSSNPNSLDTIFNGVITQVTQGEIVEVIGQSDAIELSPYVNTTDNEGDSGKIDGAFNTGLWMSEPRDLMVRLLSMGSSTFRESIAHATNGTIFSENRYGIRHFGQILYEPLTDQEGEMQAKRHDQIVQAFQGILNQTSAATVGNNATGDLFNTVKTGGFDALLGDANVRTQVAPLMLSLWTNFARHRDYELFKRNIYPGNGTGIAQYLGGDFPEAGLLIAQAAGPGREGGLQPTTPYPVTAEVRNANKIKAAEQAKGSGGDAQRITLEAQGQAGQNLNNQDLAKATQQLQTQVGSGAGVSDDFNTNITDTFFSLATGIAKTVDGGESKYATNPVFQMLGIQGNDDDLRGFEEVSFRAQTYMKSVWDLFQLCAALLPNYIVAVRPFEDRSTVFYGKPHWLYTSGVIPLTTGIPKNKATDPLIKVDDEMNRLLQEAADKANPLADLAERQKLLEGLGNISPTTTQEGMPYKPTGTVESLSNTSLDKKAKLPVKSGKAVAGWHLPIGPNHEDQLKHVQIAGMPDYLAAPANFNYVKGYSGTLPHDPYAIAQNLADPGDTLGQPRAGKEPEPGAFGYFNQPNLGLLDEQWYIAMRWPYKDWGEQINGQNTFANHKQEDYRSRKVTVLNTRTGKAVVCSIADEGAPQYGGIVARLSPDTWHYMGCTEDDTIFFGFAADSTRIGPLTDAEASTLGTVFVNESIGTRESTATNEALPNAGTDAEQNRIAIYGSQIQAFDLGYDGTNYSVFEVTGRPNNFDFNNPQREDVVGHLARRLYDREYDRYWKETMHDSDLNDLKATGHGDFKSLFANVFDLGSLDDLTGAHAESDGQKSVATLLVANDIWNDFRTQFYFDNTERIGDKTVGDYISSVYADPKVNFFLDGNVAATGPNTYTLQNPHRDQGKAHEVLAGFKRWLWQNPYGRAWIVNAADIQTQWFSESDTVKDFFNNNVINALAGTAVTAEIVKAGQGLIGVLDTDKNWNWNFVQGTILEAWKYWIGLISRIGDNWQDVMFNDQSLTHAKYDKDFQSFLEAHAQPGHKAKNPLDAQRENLNNAYKNTVGRLLGLAGDSLQGLLASFRLELQTTGMGLDMVGLMQKQAHVMNKVFNDSIYYGAGTNPNSLLRMADNPFTREYGEPVIEIRQPFQRMHYIDSFQHILSNGIQENLAGVSTVVTASSDGKYPVTVYFDKGISSERQVEKAVETGLFWDNARGAGFFSFLHPLLHPVEMLRGTIKTATGSSDELLSKRVALWHLKESLKDIYAGEIIILGNPSIRPHDLIYIADISERVYGMFEVEQVVHTFTPEEGFISSITPNAIVTINDPGRWAMISWVQSMFANKNLRDDTRNLLKVWADDTSEINRTDVAVKDIAGALSTQILGHTMYTHGSSALVKDIMSARGTGLLLSKAERLAKLKEIQDAAKQKQIIPFSGGTGTVDDQIKAGNDATIGLIPGAALVQDMVWSGWDWVRDNLLDQHGCYIQYLNKDGVAMDAGLSYAQGVAVGRHHSISLLPGILGINVPTNEDGNARITVNDQLSQLGWSEIETAKQYRFTSWWESRINAEVLKLSGHTSDPLGLSGQKIVPYPAKLNVELSPEGEPRGIIDGDTVGFYHVDNNGNVIASDPSNPDLSNLRMSGVDAPELGFKHQLEFNRSDDPGLLAWQFAKKRLHDDPIAEGYEPTFVVRPGNGPLNVINGRQTTYEHFGRPIGVIFHNVPVGTPPEKRIETLMKIASQWPLIEWDSYMDDGRPYTFNWEMIMNGHSQTYAYDLTVMDKNRGGVGSA